MTTSNEDNRGQSQQVIEIFDPELAMCLESRGFKRKHLRVEQGLEIFTYDITRALSNALEACDPDYEHAIWSIRDVDSTHGDHVPPQEDGLQGITSDPLGSR